jgi:peptidoglycan/LPS O-acetylase OafA/YrhL
LYSILIVMPASVVASWYNAPGTRFVSLEFNFHHAVGMFAAGVLVALAHTQRVTAKACDEHKLIV